MTSLGDFLGDSGQSSLFSKGISIGDVLLMEFDGIDHPKFFVVVGICKEKISICSVYINSHIHASIMAKKELLSLQVPIRKSNNGFLKYDSFVSCSTTIPLEAPELGVKITNGECKVIGSLEESELKAVIETVKTSGLLSEEEIELYFPEE